MKKRFSSYPIGELLLQTFIDSRLTLPDFVHTLGYGNTHKGIATFDHWLKKGSGNALFVERWIRSPYAPDPESLRQAISATDQILREERRTEQQRKVEEERAAFHPFVQGVAELTRPTSITMFALCGGPSRYTVQLPEKIMEWATDERESFVRTTILANYAKNEGRTPFMGRITGYLLFGAYGEKPVQYSNDGIRLGEIDAQPAQQATLTINGRPLPHGLLSIQSIRS